MAIRYLISCISKNERIDNYYYYIDLKEDLLHKRLKALSFQLLGSVSGASYNTLPAKESILFVAFAPENALSLCPCYNAGSPHAELPAIKLIPCFEMWQRVTFQLVLSGKSPVMFWGAFSGSDIKNYPAFSIESVVILFSGIKFPYLFLLLLIRKRIRNRVCESDLLQEWVHLKIWCKVEASFFLTLHTVFYGGKYE